MLHNLSQLIRYRGLIQSLVARDLKARYRGSVLGFFWTFVNPLLLLLMYSFVFTTVMPNNVPGVQPYALFMFCGILPWNWFSTSLSDAAGSLIAGGNLIKKVLFPAEVLPIVSVLTNMVHFFLGLPILIVFLLVSRHYPDPSDLLWFPIVVLVQLIFSAALALMLSALAVHFRDIRDILSNALMLWFFARPKIYRRYGCRQFSTLKGALLQRSIMRNLQPGETFPALTDVSFSVPKGATFGVIGRNGSGKSTALKLVAGITKPTMGTVHVEGRISALIELGAGFHPEISGRENVFINGIMLGLSKREIQNRFDEIVEFAELREFIDAPVKTYSSGMYMRLGFAVAIHVEIGR